MNGLKEPESHVVLRLPSKRTQDNNIDHIGTRLEWSVSEVCESEIVKANSVRV